MQFSIQKTVILKRHSHSKGLVNAIILVIAVPVIIIAGISLSLYFVFVWLKRVLFKEKINYIEEDHYHFEIDLINNQQVQIILIEDELDTELTAFSEAWQEKVTTNETYLYRARTIPSIPALDGLITCFYCKEQYDGVFLQVISTTKSGEISTPESQLLFLNYKNLGLSLIDKTGAFFLYNDGQNDRLIRGFNKKEKMTLELLPINGTVV